MSFTLAKIFIISIFGCTGICLMYVIRWILTDSLTTKWENIEKVWIWLGATIVCGILGNIFLIFSRNKTKERKMNESRIIHILRRYFWKIFRFILLKLGYMAECTGDYSRFYIGKWKDENTKN